ncbi:MAG: hypothetical protein QME12_07670 [Nanoarchaeota archaeon]|nr:hypothetical protein [Nanoarchaeota archaeon]
MKQTYWLLWILSFLVLALVCFVLYPATAIATGFIVGFAYIYRGLEPAAGTLIMQWSKVTWMYWESFAAIIVIITTIFTVVTKAVQRSSRFRKLKPIREDTAKKDK